VTTPSDVDSASWADGVNRPESTGSDSWQPLVAVDGDGEVKADEIDSRLGKPELTTTRFEYPDGVGVVDDDGMAEGRITEVASPTGE
jgi:hypothetical protein